MTTTALVPYREPDAGLRPRDVSSRALVAYGLLAALVVIGLAIWLPSAGRAS